MMTTSTTTSTIDHAAIPEVFRRLGLTPRRRITFGRYGDDRAICGCIVMALHLDQTGESVAAAMEAAVERHEGPGPSVSGEAFLAADERYGRDFVGGLVGGWDGCGSGMTTAELKQYPAWKLGYHAGRASWDECVKAGLAKETA